MPIKSKAKRANRRIERAERYRKRVPVQSDGMPQGKHLAGFKGTKVDATCFCGGCYPKNKDKVLTTV